MIKTGSLEQWLPRVRWWPYTSADGVRIVDRWSTSGGYIFLILEYKGGLFYLPLARSNSPPSFIPRERILRLGDTVFYEAEFSPGYPAALEESSQISVERVENIRLCRRSKGVKPLSFETTNVIALHECCGTSIVIKSYRRISRENPEPMFLKLLTEKGYRYSPRIYTLYRYRGDTVSIALEYVPSEGDGGLPFYRALVKALKTREPEHRIGLASLLGVEIAELHKTIAGSSNRFFTPEPITDADIRLWCNTIEGLYGRAIKNLEKLYAKGMGIAERLIHVLDRMSRPLIDTACSLLEEYRGMLKQRIHGDLHLAQFAYTRDRGFILVDFEGEPGRPPGEVLWKLPVLRDIASMIRSFQYLGFFALKEVSGDTIEELSIKLLEGRYSDPTAAWRNAHIRALTTSYIASLAGSMRAILGVNARHVVQGLNRLLLPWVIERGLYEVYYETSYGRTLIPVPIVGLKEVYDAITEGTRLWRI